MGLYGVMRSSVSGMSAQSSKLGSVSDNIINSGTIGYKRADTEFRSIVTSQGSGIYNSGSVEARTRYEISRAGNLDFTTSVTDLAIEGNGFFVVADADGSPALTRAGRFVPDADGNLVNTAGYYLQGFDLENGAPSVVANSLSGLDTVNIKQVRLEAEPTTTGSMAGNLPSNAAVIAPADLPSAGGTQYTAKTSMIAYDDVGNEVQLDIYFSKTGTDTWEASVFNAADATSGGFPYTPTVTTPHGNTYTNPMATQAVTFDSQGTMTGGSPIAFHIPDHVPATEDVQFSINTMTQLAADFSTKDPVMNGNPPQNAESIEITNDGTLYAIYENGNRTARFRIPLANAPSPDNLQPLGGEVFVTTEASGDVMVGFPGESGFGTMRSKAVEGSNVDLANELTNMIVAQRSFSANSKVFQTGSDLLNEVVNLKR